jgi:hypothetical protein
MHRIFDTVGDGEEIMNLQEANDNTCLLCDFIEVYQALEAQWHGYVNDPADVDREGCFV